jgi:hypothetical protein
MILQAAIGVGIFLVPFIMISFIIARIIVWLFQTVAWLISGRHVPYYLYLKGRNVIWLTVATMFALIALVIYLLRDYTFL